MDTCNWTDGKYNMTLGEVTWNRISGIINMTHEGWTEKGRRWNTNEEKIEADTVKQFIHSLVNQPIKFELEDDKLNVDYDGENYHFIPVS